MSVVVVARLYLAGMLHDESSIELVAEGDLHVIGEIGARHSQMVTAADSEGIGWMVELIFPDGDHVRWGTDADGMVQPIPVDDLVAALNRRYE